MKKKAFLLLTSVLLISCSQVFTRVVFGVKKEKIETQESIIKYSDQIGLNTQSNFYFADSLFSIKNSNYFPRTFIYNDSGKVVEYLDCFGSTIDDLNKFFSDYSDVSAPVKPDSLGYYKGQGGVNDINSYNFIVPPTFETIRNTTFPINNGSPVELEGSKYYIVHYWIKPLHRANKNMYSKVEEIISKHPEYRAKFIKINLDCLEENGYPKDHFKKKKG